MLLQLGCTPWGSVIRKKRFPFLKLEKSITSPGNIVAAKLEMPFFFKKTWADFWNAWVYSQMNSSELNGNLLPYPRRGANVPEAVLGDPYLKVPPPHAFSWSRHSAPTALGNNCLFPGSEVLRDIDPCRKRHKATTAMQLSGGQHETYDEPQMRLLEQRLHFWFA